MLSEAISYRGIKRPINEKRVAPLLKCHAMNSRNDPFIKIAIFKVQDMEQVGQNI